MFHDKAHKTEHAVKMISPVTSTGFLPRTSANLPKGIESRADEIIYPVTTQLILTAPALKSRDMAGTDRLSALPVNVVMNDVMSTTIRVDDLLSFIMFSDFHKFFRSYYYTQSGRNYHMILFYIDLQDSKRQQVSLYLSEML